MKRKREKQRAGTKAVRQKNQGTTTDVVCQKEQKTATDVERQKRKATDAERPKKQRRATDVVRQKNQRTTTDVICQKNQRRATDAGRPKKQGKTTDVVCQKNQELSLEIVDMGNDGEGIGRVHGYTLFVKDALIGDVVLVKVIKTKKRFGYARVMKILQPSPWRVEPVCPVSKKCGGCQLQHCSYDRQLAWKNRKIAECISRIGGIPVISNLDETVASEAVDRTAAGTEMSGGKTETATAGTEMTGGKTETAADKAEIMDGRKEDNTGRVVCMEPILGMDKPYHYRNKAQFPVGYDKSGNLTAGFYAGRTHDIIPCTDCVIQHPCNKILLDTILEFMKEYDITAYREESHTGLVRHILTRVGEKTGEVMVCLIINGSDIPHHKELIQRLLQCQINETERIGAGVREDVPTKGVNDISNTGEKKISDGAMLTVKSICINVNTEKTNVILGQEIIPLYGQPYITDFIGNICYQISPLSFYQVNPRQTEKLYETVLDYADLQGGEVVWDLYCGIGTISLFLAQKADRVCGVEIVPQAVEDARKNACLNQITNVEFFLGAAEEVVPEQYAKSAGALRADVVTLDPPRKGCDERLLETVLRMEPGKIVYVSCDPATLARDLKYLCGRGYEVRRVRGCDMFGQTGHVETVCCLRRIK